MRLIKVTLTIIFLMIILIFTIGSIIPTIIKVIYDLSYRPEVNLWKLGFSIIQLLIAIYFVFKGLNFIFRKTKVQKNNEIDLD